MKLELFYGLFISTLFYITVISFLDNQAALGGGGLYCSDCGIQVLRQTIFARNNAPFGGGGALMFAPLDLAVLTGESSDLNTAVYEIGYSGVSFYDNAALFASSIGSSTCNSAYALITLFYIFLIIYMLH